VHDTRHESLAGAGLAVEQQRRHITVADRVECGEVADLISQRAN
jgi:hypothetical protein